MFIVHICIFIFIAAIDYASILFSNENFQITEYIILLKLVAVKINIHFSVTIIMLLSGEFLPTCRHFSSLLVKMPWMELEVPSIEPAGGVLSSSEA